MICSFRNRLKMVWYILRGKSCVVCIKLNGSRNNFYYSGEKPIDTDVLNGFIATLEFIRGKISPDSKSKGTRKTKKK